MDFMVRKKNIILLMVILWSGQSLMGHGVKTYSDEELFLQGQLHYQAADYAQALSCYQLMKNKGKAAFYNMGNCYTYLKSPVDALVCWYRAQKGASYQDYDALETSIKDLRHEVRTGECSIYGYGRVQRFFNRAFSPYSLLSMQLLLICFWYLFFLLLRYYKRSVLFLLYLICILMGIFFVSGGVWFKSKQQWYRHAVVRSEQASLFSGPDTKYHVLFSVRLIDELQVCEHIPGWCRVQAGDGTKAGWIEEGDIEIVE